MPLNFKLPEGIWALRFGYHPESEYDIDGRLAPVTWVCNCGYHFRTERLEWENDDSYYVLVSEEERNQFLSEHVGCIAKCHKCHTTPVDRYGMWCDPCEERGDSFFP